MSKSSARYWEERRDQLNASLEKDEQALMDKVGKDYDKQLTQLEKEVAAYYQQYGDGEVLEYRQLLQSLSDEDRALLMERMDDFAKKYPEYEHLMPVRESIYKLDRAQGLQQSIYMHQLEIGAIEQAAYREHLEKLAAKGYAAAGGRNLLNDAALRKLVNQGWLDGKNFSDRIWGNKERLAGYLQQDFRNAIIRGDSYEKCVKELQRRHGVGKSDAYRLIYTEGTHVMNESSMMAFEEGFEQYRYAAIMDGKTSDVCKALDGQVFNIKDRMPGTNFPPMHPRCRSSYTIEIADDFVDQYVEAHGGDGGDAIENEESTKGLNKETRIDRKVIESNEYERKFNKLGEDDGVRRVLLEESRKMLQHRDGTLYEDLVFLDANAGEVLRANAQDLEQRVNPTKNMKKWTREEGRRIIAIHNHPYSSFPSDADVNVCSKRGYAYGLVVGHDGSIYKYRVTSEYDYTLYRTLVAKSNRRGYNINEEDFVREAKRTGVEIEVL